MMDFTHRMFGSKQNRSCATRNVFINNFVSDNTARLDEKKITDNDYNSFTNRVSNYTNKHPHADQMTNNNQKKENPQIELYKTNYDASIKLLLYEALPASSDILESRIRVLSHNLGAHRTASGHPEYQSSHYGIYFFGCIPAELRDHLLNADSMLKHPEGSCFAIKYPQLYQNQSRLEVSGDQTIQHDPLTKLGFLSTSASWIKRLMLSTETASPIWQNVCEGNEDYRN